MIYFLRVISSESEDFVMDMGIDSQSFFSDLHHYIQDRLKFDPYQITSFIITDKGWNKEQEITLIDMEVEGQESLVMDKVRLEELIHDEKQRFLYVFDMFAERVLFLEVTDIDEGRLKEPVSVREQGIPPAQFTPESFDFDGTDGLHISLLDEEQDDTLSYPGDIFDDLPDDLPDDTDPEDLY